MPQGCGGTGASSCIAARSTSTCSRLYRITSRNLASFSSMPGPSIGSGVGQGHDGCGRTGNQRFSTGSSLSVRAWYADCSRWRLAAVISRHVTCRFEAALSWPCA